MSKVMVTGGAGFFGANLAKKLIDENYTVKVLDIEDIKDPRIINRVEFIKCDIRDSDKVMSACEGVDYVFHNAAILPVSRATNNLFRDVNVNGTKSVLKASLANKIKKVIFMSSSAPYGIPREVPITERTPFNPVCDYGRSKIEAEKICNEYRKKGLNIVILRPRTIVGVGRLGIFQILYSWIADNKNIYVLGNGNNLFQDIGVDDMVRGCMLAMEKNCDNEDFNLGTDKFDTVRNGLQALIDYAGSSSKIVSIHAGFARAILRTLDIFNLAPFTSWHYNSADKSFYFDISKARRILNWQPLKSNIDTYKEGIDWYIEHRKEIDSDFGTTHGKSVKQKILKILKFIS